MCPIQTLPAELICEVFQFVVDAAGNSEFDPKYFEYVQRFEYVRTVLVLSQVCARWRRLAHTTPELWMRQDFPIEVVKPRKYGDATKISMDATKVCLDRSGSLPISVDLGDFDQDAAAPFLKELLCHTNRWRTLSLSMGLISALIEIPLGGLTRLESVDLSLLGESTPDALPSKLTTFLGAPRLRSVSLTAQHLPFLPMPWSQLTHLTLIGHHSSQPYLDTLVLCPQLVSAELKMMGWPQGGFPPASHTSTVTLPRLEKLCVKIQRTTEGEHLTPLLRLLNLPALRTLIFDLNDDADDFKWSVLEFTQFQLRSPHIEHVDLISCNLDSADLQNLLLHAVGLKHLELIYCPNCINDSLFVDPVHLAPKLETLVLKSSDNDFDENNLDVMIRSRWWTDDELHAMPGPPAVARWKRLQFRMGDQAFSRYFIEHIVERCRGQGLNLEGPFPERRVEQESVVNHLQGDSPSDPKASQLRSIYAVITLNELKAAVLRLWLTNLVDAFENEASSAGLKFDRDSAQPITDDIVEAVALYEAEIAAARQVTLLASALAGPPGGPLVPAGGPTVVSGTAMILAAPNLLSTRLVNWLDGLDTNLDRLGTKTE
ncbi:hypothetical protein B0H15DRAFT_795287 [Mycena belliarum]|uniref:F-box domain-containing protein n=1 Tax=Mycena belliarum TaxID=1033014 RepID=A0AAD6XTZ3_9AGAR|nr:hypothetical protein B0H15DRAFT_795287 [Mycena belliae]